MSKQSKQMKIGELLIGGSFVGGACDSSVAKEVVKSPYTGNVVGSVAEAGKSEAKAAVQSAAEAFTTWRTSSLKERQDLLRSISSCVQDYKDELVELLALEVGKPMSWGAGEVSRLALTFSLAADLLSTYGTESLPTSWDPRGESYAVSAARFPIGVIFGIVAYNWPFNLAAHKVAPALATGNTVVLKASPQSALCTLRLAKLIQSCGLPDGVVNAINCGPETSEYAMLQPEVAMVSFTGSVPVGWHIKKVAWEKKVALELGGNAFSLVLPSCDLRRAAKRLAEGAYGYAGQVCISVQNVLVHDEIYSEFREMLTEETNRTKYGDPFESGVICGPMISESAAERAERWVGDAVARGATVLAGGSRSGSVFAPTLVEGVPTDCELFREEVFAPVMTLRSVSSLSEGINLMNESQYGLQASVFTRDITESARAYRELEVGGVIINDWPNMRFDNMPYGGIKKSGFGREGVRYAMDEMTELKALVTYQGE
ncbi:MAG: aldehyde dehydrogenase family protein [Fimbriimonadaceae bacterium]